MEEAGLHLPERLAGALFAPALPSALFASRDLESFFSSARPVCFLPHLQGLAVLPSGKCSPWPHGLQFPAGFGAGTRKGRLERSEWGETRVAEGASARGDGENPERGPGDA